MSSFTTMYNFTVFRIYNYAEPMYKRVAVVTKANRKLTQTEFHFPFTHSVAAVPLCPQSLSDCQISTTVFIYLKLRLPILLSFKQLQFCLFKLLTLHSFLYLEQFKSEFLSIRIMISLKTKKIQKISPDLYKKGGTKWN